ncbi:MAG: sulfate ABC transporter substrate-binding protein [Tildeniella nuda ZEHNDER 1965/U140]|nr:sulfate ABC transporter substrate-binding protein [Tildeniella nuda ZEHNDER 1965/U140]
MQSYKKGSALLVAAGFGLAVSFPVIAASPTAPSAPSIAQGQRVSQQPKTVELTLVSFAVTKEAHDKIIPLFQEKWKREQGGQAVKFNRSYAGSGTQARAVVDGLEADVVSLALALDTYRVQKAGLINPGWEKDVPNDGIVSRSVITFVTRPGNPKGIRTWADLVKPGITVITANPKTSGGARWNFLGLWGSVGQIGTAEDKAREYVTQVYRNAPVLPKDAREATDAFFKQGQGDVLLNYENEMILASQKGESGFFTVVPQTNISIDNPIAVVDKNVDKHGTRAVSEAFVQFLFTPEAQREFAKVGFRPVNTAVAKEFDKKFPKVTKLYTAKDFGGWDTIQKKFFDDGTVFDQIYTAQR